MVPIIRADHTYDWTCRVKMKSRCEFNRFVLNFNNDKYCMRVFYLLLLLLLYIVAFIIFRFYRLGNLNICIYIKSQESLLIV